MSDTDLYPWRNTSADISAGTPPQWETPGGAQEKVDTGIEEFAALPETGLADESVTTRKLRDAAVDTQKIALAAVTLEKMDPAPMDAANHTYSGAVAADTVKEAIDVSSARVEYFIAHSGDSVAEIVDARIPETGSPFPKLGDRLNNTDAQLAEKAEQSEVTTTVLRVGNLETGKLDKTGSIAITQVDKNQGLIDQTYLSPALIAQIAGTAPVNAIPDKDSIVTNQLAFQPVQGLPSKNLLDKSRVTSGNFINYTTGALSPSADFFASDFMAVSPSTAYYKNTFHQMAFYDASKVYISGLNNGIFAFTTPSNAAYARISVLNTDLATAQFEKGTAASPYEPFRGALDPSTVRDSSLPKAKLDFVAMEGKIKNLFDKEKVTGGYYIDGADGVMKASAAFSASDWMVVSPNTAYYKNTYHLGAWYDSNKSYISGFVNGSHALTSPANAKYCRISVDTTLLSTAQFELGTVETAYESATAKIDGAQIRNLPKEFKPLRIMQTLKEVAPLYFQKLKAQTADVTTVLIGDSISTTNYYTTPRTDAKYRPPLMTEHAYVTQIEEWLRWDGQKYYRYDSGTFTETASTAVTKEYDLAWDWVYAAEAGLPAINNRPALTRVLDGTNASVSYVVPSGVKRCDFIYRTDYLNAASAAVAVSSGNGVLQVYNEGTGTWVEANGYTYSAQEANTIIAGTSGNLRKSIYQKRLKMRVVGTLGTTTVTITNSGSGRLTYWGIQTGIREFMHDFILSARGGHSIARLANFEAWDVDYYKPDVILWELPIINQGLDVANSSFVPNTMTKTTDVYAGEFLTKANQLLAKAYAPELLSWVMLHAYGNNAINDSDEWVYGSTSSGQYVSVPNYISKTVSLFDANDLVLLDMFSLYMDYARRRSAYEGGSIRNVILKGSGMTGTSLTIDGAHFNDTGAAVTADAFGSFFVQ